MEGGERLVFEARTPKWRAWLALASGIACLALAGWLLWCVGTLLKDMQPFYSLWSTLGREFVRIPFLLFLNSAGMLGFGCWLIWLGRTRLRQPVSLKLVVDETGLEFSTWRDWGVKLAWSDVMALRAFEADPKPKRCVIRLAVLTEAGLLDLTHLVNKEAVLDALLARTNFVKRGTKGLDDWYGSVTSDASSSRARLRPLALLPSRPQDLVWNRRLRKLAGAGALLLVACWMALVLWSKYFTPITELPTEVHSLALPIDAKLTSRPVWAADSSKLFVTIRSSSTTEQGEQTSFAALVEVMPGGQLRYLTPWYQDASSPGCSSEGWLAFSLRRNQLTEAEQQTLKRGSGAPPYTQEELRIVRKQHEADLWLVAPGSRVPHKVKQPEPAGVAGLWTWSPSGKLLTAFCSYDESEGKVESLWVVPSDSSSARGKRYLAPAKTGLNRLGGLEWSPDERSLALLGFRRNEERGRKDDRDLVLVLDLASGQWRAVASLRREEGFWPLAPCWSDDSLRLTVLASDWWGLGADEVEVATGARERRYRVFAPDPYWGGSGVSWTANGQALALALTVPSDTPGRSSSTSDDLIIESAKGPTRLPFIAEWYAYRSAWSPDGKWLALPTKQGLLFVKVPEGAW